MIELFTLNPGITTRKKAKKLVKVSRNIGPVITGKISTRRKKMPTYYNPLKIKRMRRGYALNAGVAGRSGWKDDAEGHRIAAMLGHARDLSPRRPLKAMKKAYEGTKYPVVSQTEFFRYRDRHPFSDLAWGRVHKRRKRAGKGPKLATPWISIAGKRTKYAANPSKRRRGPVAPPAYRHLTKYFSRRVGGRPGFEAAGLEWRRLTGRGRLPAMPVLRRRYPLAIARNPGAVGENRRKAKKNMVGENRRYASWGYNRKGKKVRKNYRYTAAPVMANYRYTAAPVMANARYELPAQFATNPMEAVMEFPKRVLNVDFLKKNVLPFAGGAIGSKIIAAQAAKLILGAEKNPARYAKYFGDAGWKKALWEIGSGMVAGMGIGLATKGEQTDFAMKVAAGGLLAGLLTLVETSGSFEAVRKLYEGKKGFAEIGATAEEELKEKIAAELKTELEGFGNSGVGEFAHAANVGDYFDVDESEEAVEGELPTLSAFVTTDALPEEQEKVTLDNFGAMPGI